MNTSPRAQQPECFISVDIETAGPVPAQYSMLSVGACLVDDPDTTFYVEIRPELTAAAPEALRVSGLSIEHLVSRGTPPKEAMTSFANWIERVVPGGQRPVFTAFNAAFDWMFICDYFARHLGRNPFGYSALDIKAFAMGSGNSSWGETSMDVLASKHLGGRQLSHNALADAQDQAELFRRLLEERNAVNDHLNEFVQARRNR